MATEGMIVEEVLSSNLYPHVTIYSPIALSPGSDLGYRHKMETLAYWDDMEF